MTLERDDADLERQALDGDPAAFGQILRRHDDHLRGVAWSVVRNHHAVDDVMQDAYEKAFRSIDRFDGRSAVSTWLHSIVYRTAIDHLRYEGRRRHDDVESLVTRSGGDTTSEGALGRIDLADVLDDLNPEQRAALMLTAGLGYSFDEVAEITGDRRGTIASRVSRARTRLARKERP